MDFFKSLSHPDEIYALLRYKFIGPTWNNKSISNLPSNISPDLLKCYDFLNKTSRSFSVVIQSLDDKLRDAVCIFYLVLRALDTVEDDMTIELDEKIQLLTSFYTFLEDPEWKYERSKEKDRMVLEDFSVISSEYRRLSSTYRSVISEICQKMGEGMTVYLTKSPDSLEEWNEYCHYVAGLVGIGLSRLFSSSKLEDVSIGNDDNNIILSNSMGVFLQKTNIIRDYLEDVKQGRNFWPKQVWGKYSDQLINLSDEARVEDAVKCLNDLIMNALVHVPDVINYLSRIRNQSVFNFCSIPQVMAIATLAKCYGNQQVFSSVVKIRKGEAVRLMLKSASNIEEVKAIFSHFINQIKSKILLMIDDRSEETNHVIRLALDTCSDTSHVYMSNTIYFPIHLSFVMLLGAIIYNYWSHWIKLLLS